MAFTGRPGTDESQPGNLQPGAEGSWSDEGAYQADAFQNDAFQVESGGVETDFTADAVVLREQTVSFTANAILLVTQSASFTADATIIAAPAASFTADAVIFATIAASFTADAVITTGSVETSFTADAFIRPYFRADAVIQKTQSASFTANAVKAVTQSRSLTTDSYILGYSFQKHDRTDAHEGDDHDTDHTVAWNFDRYFRGDNLQYVLADFDARLTARELGMTSKLYRLLANAIIRRPQSASLTGDAYLVLGQSASFTADAFILPHLDADAWITDPAYFIEDDVLVAPTWAIDAVPRAAVISSADLTWDSTNDPDWYYGAGESYLSGWVKFTLAAPSNVRIDTLNTQGDTVIELWTGGPGAWDIGPYAIGDEDIADPTNPYGISDIIDTTGAYGTFVVGSPGPLAAGTYYVLIHPFDQVVSPDFNLVLRIRTL